MDNTKIAKYVGDIISDNGKNDLNIADRKAKGFGISDDILAILDEVPFGQHRIEAGVLMRDSMLISSMLGNSAVWYNLSQSDIN